MRKMLEVTVNDGSKIYIEMLNSEINNENDCVFVPASSGEEIIKKTINQLGNSLSSIGVFSNMVIEKIRDINICPDEIEVDFSVKIAADACVIISTVSSEANLVIKMKWKNSDKESK